MEIDDANAWAVAAHAAALVGRPDEADAWGRHALARATAVDSAWAEIRAREALGCAALARDDAPAAVRWLAGAREVLERERVGEPGWYRVEGDLAEALVATGAIAEAEALTSVLGAAARGGGHPWTRLVAARSAGLCAAAAGRTDAARESFEASLAADADDEMPFETGRTFLALGSALRRANRRRDARAALEAALARFTAVGSAPWAGRARSELATISGRVARPTELSVMEERVAGLAAAGRSNREIADELFLSVRTVESHLSTAYGKVGVASRTALVAELARRARVDGG